jgi:FemAB-related protein (PEP-CTERM system-associated)
MSPLASEAESTAAPADPAAFAGDVLPVDTPVTLELFRGRAALDRVAAWNGQFPAAHPAHDFRWLGALSAGLCQEPIVVAARRDEQLVALLPLALVSTPWFGRFLVSLPYVNSASIVPNDSPFRSALLERAVGLADELNVRYLEIRGEREDTVPALADQNTSKVHMRLALPVSTDALMGSFKSKLRSQLKGALKHEFEVRWGGADLVGDFYSVFSRNMRDLGTPVFPRRFFTSIVQQFDGDAEICVLRHQGEVAAGALLVHGREVTEVPSASSLRQLNSTGVNMAMYWHLLSRAIERGQQVFDFGRSTVDSNTYKFKAQWGAEAHPAVWQYYVRRGTAKAMRPDSGKFGLAIRIWKRLPLWLANALGPAIVRGIP